MCRGKNGDRMRAMRRVKQLHDNGCGVASVATIARVGYRKAESYFKGCDLDDDGVQSRHVRWALGKLKVNCSKKLIPLNGKDFREFPFDALIRIKLDEDLGHFVVWDSGKRRIIDPLEPPLKQKRLLKHAASYIRIYGRRNV